MNIRNQPIALDSNANNKDNNNSKNNNFINNVNAYKDTNSNTKYPKINNKAKDYILTAIKQHI